MKFDMVSFFQIDPLVFFSPLPPLWYWEIFQAGHKWYHLSVFLIMRAYLLLTLLLPLLKTTTTITISAGVSCCGIFIPVVALLSGYLHGRVHIFWTLNYYVVVWCSCHSLLLYPISFPPKHIILISTLLLFCLWLYQVSGDKKSESLLLIGKVYDLPFQVVIVFFIWET